jgi:RNA polymerase sigma-70 factor (ECF subfamily)
MTTDANAQEWCQRAVSGDREAAGQLVQHFHQTIYAYLRRLAGSDADAADLTQQTFAQMWRSLAKFRGASTFRSWLHCIAYCNYVDWLRTRRPTVEPSPAWWEALPGPEQTPSESAADVELARRLYRLVEQLTPESARTAVHLHYYQGLSLAETAEVLSMPVSTLKYQLRAALDWLRGQLTEPGQVGISNL